MTRCNYINKLLTLASQCYLRTDAEYFRNMNKINKSKPLVIIQCYEVSDISYDFLINVNVNSAIRVGSYSKKYMYHTSILDNVYWH